MVGEAARIPPWPLKESSQPLPLTHRTGKYGIAWDFMGVNGLPWAECISARENSAKLPPSSSFLVNGLRLPLLTEAVTTANERGCTFPPLIRRARSSTRSRRRGGRVPDWYKGTDGSRAYAQQAAEGNAGPRGNCARTWLMRPDRQRWKPGTLRPTRAARCAGQSLLRGYGQGVPSPAHPRVRCQQLYVAAYRARA